MKQYTELRRKKPKQNALQPFQVPVESPETSETGGKILSVHLCTAPAWKTVFRYIAYLSTGFIMWLLCYWVPTLLIGMSLKHSDIDKATRVIIYGADKNVKIVPLTEEKISNQNLKVFHYRLFKYYYDTSTKTFRQCRFKIEDFTCNQIHQKFGRGLDEVAVSDHTTFFGKNLTDIHKRSCLKLLIHEILSPLYCFELYCLAVWCNDDYMYYAILLFIFSAVSIAMGLYETIQTNGKLRIMSYYEAPITVFRKLEGETTKLTLNSSELVPGDVIEIPQAVIPCDAIILNGSCIVDESMLTGESVPVIKSSLPYNNDLYDLKEDKHYTIYAGTKCIQARYYQEKAVLALVTSTGFATVKGDLIRTMLYPKPTDFRFYSDAFKFVSILGAIAVAGFLIDLPGWLIIGGFDSTLMTILVKTSEIITVTVPPALPTCIQIGVSMALARLQKKSIYCTSPMKINEAGRVNVMCFDKTGTLTEEGLELYGVRPIFFDKNTKSIRFMKVIQDAGGLVSYVDEETRESDLQDYIGHESFTNKLSIYKTTRMFPSEQMLEIMATCHSLTMIGNKMVGDPLDLKMFSSTSWALEENDQEKYDALVLAVVKPPSFRMSDLDEKSFKSSLNIDNKEIGIIRRFDFSSKLQRMCVVVKNLSEAGFKAHAKGAPEKIRELCKPETIPKNFHRTLEKYTEHGFRVLACATKSLGANYRRIMAANREDIEKEFTFIGFLIMENRLREATTEVIDLLQEAEVKTIMVTGDNVLTAISVARQCHIVGQNQRVFLGDLSEKKVNGKFVIQWKDFDFSERVLNVDLEPDFHNESGVIEHPTVLISDREQFRDNINVTNNEPTEDLEKNEQSSNMLRQSLLSQSSMHLRRSKGAMSPERYKKGFISTAHINDLGIPFFNIREHGDYCIAVTGRAFSLIVKQAKVNKDPQYQYMLQKLLRRCLVFARMLPDEKATMIKYLMGQPKHVVGMCGDGANDVAALKTAHVGVSLSEAEASIAAPFTSGIPDISCIPILLREGRSALSTSYQEFKFVALYSIIQFVGVTLLYSQTMDFTNWDYYHVDVFIVLTLSATMAMSGAYDKLTVEKPAGRLISVPILTSVIGQMVIQILFQVGSYVLLIYQSWYDPQGCPDNFDTGDACFENSTLYIVSIYQYCIVALVYMVGKPFKKPFYTNKWFTCTFVILMILNILVTYNPFNWQFLYDEDQWAAEMPLSYSWRNTLMLIIILNTIATIVWEKVVVVRLTRKWKGFKDNKRKKIEALKSMYRPPSVAVSNVKGSP